MMRKAGMVLLLAGSLVACARDDSGSIAETPAPPVESVRPAATVERSSQPAGDPAERAKAAAADFSGRLRGALQSRLQADGPVAAVDFCHTQAPLIAEEVSKVHGVRLGRVAVPGRNRNPANEPEGWQRDTLAAFQAAVDRGEAAGAQLSVLRDDLPDGVALRMMRGIAVEPPCLACHGRQVAPAVSQVIARHYPDDRATGFDIGDLRGGLWVEVSASSTQN